ncbi:MAG: serine/threonine-protein kinase [Gemmataceae bacterium]
MTNQLDAFLIELLVGSRSLSSNEVTSLLQWWRDNAELNQGLASFLVQAEVLRSDASKTLELSQKGYFRLSDCSSLMAESGLKTLREQIEQYKGPGLTAKLRSENEKTQVSIRQVSPTIQETAGRAVATGNDMSSLSRKSAGQFENRRRTVQVGDVLGKCLLTDVLGEGGSGVVFRALHRGLRITVAVKVLLPSGDHAVGPSYQRFQTEARLLAQVNHASIVRVLDFEDDLECPYLVQEYINGPNLAQLIAQTGGLRQERALEIIKQTTQALWAAWEVGIVHRDIKPQNILLTKEGRVKVVDFGLAGVCESTNPRQWKPDDDLLQGGVGTVLYMAPEQFSTSNKPDFRSDIYSLGVTLFQAITGMVPFHGATPTEIMVKHYSDPRPSVSDYVLDVTPELDEFVKRMMAVTPETRFSCYRDVLDALGELESTIQRTKTSRKHTQLSRTREAR